MILRCHSCTVPEGLQGHFTKALDLPTNACRILKWRRRCKEVSDFPKVTGQGQAEPQLRLRFLFSSKMSCSFHNSTWLTFKRLFGNTKHCKCSFMHVPPPLICQILRNTEKGWAGAFLLWQEPQGKSQTSSEHPSSDNTLCSGTKALEWKELMF